MRLFNQNHPALTLTERELFTVRIAVQALLNECGTPPRLAEALQDVDAVLEGYEGDLADEELMRESDAITAHELAQFGAQP